MIKLAISGVLGKMGQVLLKAVKNDSDFEYIGGFDRAIGNQVVSTLESLKNADVLIDFSTPMILKDLLTYAKAHKVALVLATTGYSDKDFELIQTYSAFIPIFYSANYAIGIHLLTKALQLISQSIDESYDIEMIDTHHRFKKDAPSGTAFKLYDALNLGLKDKRQLIVGTKPESGIHVHSLRLGNYVGKHDVIFSNLSETLTLSHEAHDKSVFALGAIKAAKFIKNKNNGLYGMDDLLGEK